MRVLKHILFILYIGTNLSLYSQNQYKDEAEMIKAANVLFENEEYGKAMPLFSQLVSLYPKDATYNMKYGACLLFAEKDKADCLKYLKYGAGKSESGPQAHYYYGLGLHRNYDFSKAIKQYNKFKVDGNKKKIEEWQIDRQIEMCENGKALLKNIFDLNVIEKKEISQAEFFRIYDLGEIGGKIIVKPDEFKSKLDLKSKDISLMHLPADATVIYFSGYGESKANGKDIFRARKKANNEWSIPENIGNVVNTPYDEDFPFMHPDGTLYFASTGHNSMGGYDLFKSEFNESTGTWSKPENLNFAISSAFDDVLFITDYKKQLAYFASSRASVSGKINVYRVQISRKPFDKAFLSGKFIVEGETDIKAAKITIYDLESKQKIGTYFTNKENGKYNIGLPKGGKTYKFVVETDDNSPVHTGKVDIPVQEGMVSLKQEIRLVGSGDDQKLVIKNMFNETAPLNEADLALALRNSSNLEVNTTEEEVMQELATTPPEEGTESNVSSLSVKAQHDQLVDDMGVLLTTMNRDLGILKNQIAFGFKYSFKRAVIADQMFDQVDVSRQNMLNENDREKKEMAMKKLIAQKDKLNPIASDAIVSYDFTRSLANEFDEKMNDIERINSDMGKVKSSGANSDEDMQADLDQYGPLVRDIKSMRSAFEIAPQRYEDLLVKAKEKRAREESFYKETKQDIESIQLEIRKLEEKINTAKNKKTKDQLTEEKGTKEIDLQDLQYEFAGISKKYDALKKEIKNLESDAKQINAFIDKIKAGTAPMSQLSSDDQAELNKIIDFLKEQRQIEDLIGDEVDVYLAEGGKKEDLNTAHSYEAVDVNGNAVLYNEKYLVNLAGIELIADDEKRYSESAKLYDNWARTIKNDREIKENDLKFKEDKTEKQILAEHIKILEQKEREYKQIAVEYSEKGLALTQVAVVSGDQSGKERETSHEKSKDEGPPVKGLSGDSENIGSLMMGTIFAAGPGQYDIEDINETYEKARQKFDYNSDEPADEISLAAFELQWAKSIDKLIAEKELELKNTENEEDWPKIQKLTDEYKVEREEHLQAAASEFTQMQIDEQMGDEASVLDEKYYIPFNAQAENKEDYNAEYQILVSAIENHQILSAEEKNRELSMIHNFWSMTIQDDILWQENEKTKLKSQAEMQELKNEILDLNVDKKTHISLSNDYYSKYKDSKLYQVDLAQKEKAEIATVDKVVSKADANTYGDYADVYAKYREERTSQMERMEADMLEVSDKGEKQQIALALVLMKKQNEEDSKAEAELKQKGASDLMNEKADQDLTDNLGNWQEEAEDYVFTKKDFSQDVPENSLAYEDYKDARLAYEEVQYLESQKIGLLSTSVLNKDAEADLLKLKEQIEAKKLEAYIALSKANKAQYKSNRKEIDRMLEENADLQKTDPKLYRDIKAADVVFIEAEKYQKNAEGFKSNSLKFDIYDQAQFMSEYVLGEQKSIIEDLKGETYTGELAFMATSDGVDEILNSQVASFKINQREMEVIMENPIYVEYAKDRLALEDVRKERLEIQAQVVNEEKTLQSLIEQRNIIVQEASAQKKGKKKKLMKEAEVLNAEITFQQQKLDSVTLVMVQLKERENNINRNSSRLLKQASVDDRYKMVMLAELRVRGTEESTYVAKGIAVDSEAIKDLKEEEVDVLKNIVLPGDVSNKSINTQFKATGTTLQNNEFKTLGTEIPEELEGDLFITAASATVSPYNDNKPIPIDVDMPKGIVFKVQVGAYRNAIPQDLFKGFAPLMGEKLDNGITRYTAGLFRNFTNANKAKNEIRRIGYDDAFVVGFYDGKRISFQELRNLGDVDLTLPAVADNLYNGVPPEVLTTPSIIDDPGEVSSAIAEQTTNAKGVKGIFFAVQVGVYSNTLLPGKLKIFRELNSELLPSGTIRYSVGRFKTLGQAQDRRDDVLSVVSDAFVTVYEDGNRITVRQALQKLGQSGR